MATEATQTNTIPQRGDIAPQDTWDLTDIYKDDGAWEADLAKAKKLIEEAESFRGRLAESAETLWQCLESRSTMQRVLSSLYQYAYLNKDLDNRVSKYQEMTERVAMTGSQAGAAYSFVEPELLALDEAELRKLAAGFPKTDVYDFYIEELIRSKAHIRSGEVEEVLAMMGMISRGPDNIFAMLDDADLTYPSILDETGNEVQLTKQRYARFLDSKDRRVRRDTNEAFYSTYRAHLNTISATLSASVNQDVFYAKVRNYDNCLHSALDGDNIPLSVYHQLLDSTEKNLSALHSYTKLRKKILKLDTIAPYDMLCPLFPDFDLEVKYDEAISHLLEAVTPLGKTYNEVLTGAMKSRWVDVYETQGKGGGAYSYGDNVDTHPFVLMNYNDTAESMFTLAHEMGHAMHSYLANTTQPYPKARYSIFVAEVASTLNEGLLLQYLLKRVKETGERLYLLDRQLNGTMGTFFHQIMYARFELAIHEHVENGGALSPDFMTKLWHDLTLQYYGPQIEMDDDTPLKWARIPHFYRSFYVYQYATSFAASQAILKKFLDGEPGIIEKYLDMLKAGGSDYPIELLKICGVDMTTPEPVLATIEMFDSLVKEMDSLT
ncbi:oligoendopeptidase F [bacterium]|nr:oligoendopeptidase F [bacterium]